jgi:hypothetical protein
MSDMTWGHWKVFDTQIDILSESSLAPDSRQMVRSDSQIDHVCVMSDNLPD